MSGIAFGGGTTGVFASVVVLVGGRRQSFRESVSRRRLRLLARSGLRSKAFNGEFGFEVGELGESAGARLRYHDFCRDLFGNFVTRRAVFATRAGFRRGAVLLAVFGAPSVSRVAVSVDVRLF